MFAKQYVIRAALVMALLALALINSPLGLSLMSVGVAAAEGHAGCC